VLSWTLSPTVEWRFCVEAPKRAFGWGRPAIFNSDQGSQITSERFTGELESRGVAVSMDGRGRYLASIFIERLWRSLKREEKYLRDYGLVPEARTGIRNWFRFYNHKRPYQSLGYRTPAGLYLA
jgi:putative transposase